MKSPTTRAPAHARATHQRYWRWRGVTGPGAGACGFLGHVRYGNVKPGGALLHARRGREPAAPEPRGADPAPGLAERLILGPAARATASRPSAWPSAAPSSVGACPLVLDAWRARGLLTERHGRVRLTEAGFLLSDALFTELL